MPHQRFRSSRVHLRARPARLEDRAEPGSQLLERQATAFASQFLRCATLFAPRSGGVGAQQAIAHAQGLRLRLELPPQHGVSPARATNVQRVNDG